MGLSNTISSVLLLQRWLVAVACLRLFAGNQCACREQPCSQVPQSPNLTGVPFPMAVYIGFFDPQKFRIALIDKQPELGKYPTLTSPAASMEVSIACHVR
jgi:hypothetical protein